VGQAVVSDGRLSRSSDPAGDGLTITNTAGTIALKLACSDDLESHHRAGQQARVGRIYKQKDFRVLGTRPWSAGVSPRSPTSTPPSSARPWWARRSCHRQPVCGWVQDIAHKYSAIVRRPAKPALMFPLLREGDLAQPSTLYLRMNPCLFCIAHLPVLPGLPVGNRLAILACSLYCWPVGHCALCGCARTEGGLARERACIRLAQLRGRSASRHAVSAGPGPVAGEAIAGALVVPRYAPRFPPGTTQLTLSRKSGFLGRLLPVSSPKPTLNDLRIERKAEPESRSDSGWRLLPFFSWPWWRNVLLAQAARRRAVRTVLVREAPATDRADGVECSGYVTARRQLRFPPRSPQGHRGAHRGGDEGAGRADSGAPRRHERQDQPPLAEAQWSSPTTRSPRPRALKEADRNAAPGGLAQEQDCRPGRLRPRRSRPPRPESEASTSSRPRLLWPKSRCFLESAAR